MTQPMFHEGEICIVFGVRNHTEYNNSECTVVGGLKERTTMTQVGPYTRPCYVVEMSDCTKWEIDPSRLRKRFDPGSWSELFNVWQPGGGRVNLQHGPDQLTSEQMLAEANRIREELQDRTCCPEHAMQVALILAGTFAMDGREASVAARELKQSASVIAADIHAGIFSLARKFQS